MKEGSSSKKIAFVLWTNLGLGAGTEIVVSELSRELIKLDFFSEISIIQTRYLFTASSSEKVRVQSMDSVRCIEIRSPFSSTVYSLFRRSNLLDLVFKEAIYPFLYILFNHRAIKELGRYFDILFFVWVNDEIIWRFVDPSSSSSFVASGECGLPVGNEGILSRLKRHLVLKAADRIHFLTRRQFDLFGLASNTDFIVPNGVRGELFVPSRATEAPFTKFLFVGRLDIGKGVTELLSALSDLRNESWLEFRFVGNGQLRGLVEDSVGGIVKYDGFLKHDKLASVYSDADILVFPTHGESFGNVVLEAVSSRVFCILSDALKGNFDDLLQLGAIEYVENSPDAILKAIRKKRGFPVDLQTKRHWHDFVKCNYNWSRLAERLVALLE